jgi:predicted ATPase
MWMIGRLYIDGFKSLRNIELDPASINVLVGPNGSGKSSVLQTMLLLRQSNHGKGKVPSLLLSGELYEAGMPLDAIHPDANHTVRIELRDDDGAHDFHGQFTQDRNDDNATNIRRLPGEGKGLLPFALFERTGEFAYLNAERVGPRVTYPLPLSDTGLNGRVGKFGEFTTAILARAFNSQEKIDSWNDQTAAAFEKGLSALDGEALISEIRASQGSLFRLSNIMLGWIVPGANFAASENTDTDSAVLMFTRDVHGIKAKVRATHIGFGLSYALPVIVAALSLRHAHSLFLVENPEAHLHPYSQSRMGAFLALVASTGRQIFVETHSDHVINGIRLAVRYGLVRAEDVRIYFFHNSLSAEQSKVSKIEIDNRGGLASWPPGFFDQIEQDLARL